MQINFVFVLNSYKTTAQTRIQMAMMNACNCWKTL